MIEYPLAVVGNNLQIAEAVQAHLRQTTGQVGFCCNLDQICFSCSDRRLQCKSGLLGDNGNADTYYEFVNIREHCAWVHGTSPAEATAKAKGLVGAGVARAREGQPLPSRYIPVEKSALVIGGGLAGMQAAADLAAQGLPTTLLRNGGEGCPGEYYQISERLGRELERGNVRILSGAKVIDIEGTSGCYQVAAIHNGKLSTLTAGAIVLDLGGGMGLPPLLPKSGWGVEGLETEVALGRLPGVFPCGGGGAVGNADEALAQGGAAATRAAVLLSAGMIGVAETAASVDQTRCRGCGTCASVCAFGAIALVESGAGIPSASVDLARCRGCGTCVAHCPTGALSQGGYSEGQLSASLEAVLS